MDLLRSPLHDQHVALGAKMAEFGGWTMPLEYPTESGGGVLAEHAAVRERAGLFDVSHLGKASVRGAGALDHVNACLTNDLRRIGPGQAQYTLCCADDGGTIDDLIAYVRSDFDVFLVPNAANTAAVVEQIRSTAPEGVEVVDRHREYAVLAVQGPSSQAVLAAFGIDADHPYMSFVEVAVGGVETIVCRTGYTGEHGYELIVPALDAPAVWDALLVAGEPVGLRPCGLGARDTLRTEMGYPLHGHELSAEITPVMGRAAWAVGWGKEHFTGKDALQRQREEKAVPLVRGIVASGRGIPRPGMVVRAVGADGESGDVVGEVTSGTFSPTLRQGIGLALLDRSVSDGDDVLVEVRRRAEPFRVVKPPFVETNT